MTDNSFVDNDLRITCADAVELVTDYLDDALSIDDLSDFETHLGLCEGCQVFVDQVRKTVTLVATTADTSVEVMPANFDDLLAELEDQAQRRIE
jgi:anti-sigma factor RsiW